MDPTKDILQDRWYELKGLVRKRWGKLNDDDFAQMNGRTDELVLALQRRYGYGKAQAEIEINTWMRDLDGHTNS